MQAIEFITEIKDGIIQIPKKYHEMLVDECRVIILIETKKAQVQNITDKGILVLVDEQEFFMSFAEFPWFLKATIEQIYNLEFFHGKHLHWPALDIDVALESLQNPEAYPLKYS